MLEPPFLTESEIAESLRRDFGMVAAALDFLPIGADPNTAVFRLAVRGDSKPYFLKLRSGGFNETAVLVPEFLSRQGVLSIVAPLATPQGRFWGNVAEYKTILYPFIDGRDGYELAMVDQYWIDLGRALRQIHEATIPTALRDQVAVERFEPQTRETVRYFLASVIDEAFTDPISADMAAFLRDKRAEILKLVDRTEVLAAYLIAQSPDRVLCHADLHAGNVLISDDKLYIVDWDTLLLAPRERDLMVPGGAQGYSGRSPAVEERLFYQGYGPILVDPQAVAYYRGQRVIEDIAVECEQVFGPSTSETDRAQEFAYLQRNFAPDGTLAAFYRTVWEIDR